MPKKHSKASSRKNAFLVLEATEASLIADKTEPSARSRRTVPEAAMADGVN